MRLLILGLSLAAVGTAQSVTFYKDVLPVLQRNCQTVIGRAKPRPCLF